MTWATRAGVALLALCAVLQAAGIVAGPLMTRGTEIIPHWARLSGTFLLVLYAVLGWISRQGAVRRYAALIAGGMLFGHLGDLAMGGFIPSPNGWLAGMLLFGIGHGFYIAAFIGLGRRLGRGGFSPAVPIMLVLGCLLWWGLTRGSDAAALMRYGALAYTLVIAVMTGLALRLAVSQPAWRSLAAGALLFLLSDVLLGASAFRGVSGALWNDFIWLLYIAGQALLVTSVARAAVIISSCPQTPESSR